jgi:large subunit ribosomal protein L21
MDYAIIRLGNKQHRVRDGETLVVDRIGAEEGKTFQPDVLLGDDGVQVTAKVVAHERGPKIRIGKYRRRTGYRRHTGFRAATSRVEISLAAAAQRAAEKPALKAEAAADHVKGMPKGYEELTVAEIGEAVKKWNRPMLEAALAYEQEHGKRKGAVSALESALAAKEESH